MNLDAEALCHGIVPKEGVAMKAAEMSAKPRARRFALLTLLACLCCSLGLVALAPSWMGSAAQAFADGENVVASGECGYVEGDVVWTLYTDGTLAVVGQRDMVGWSSASNVPWYRYKLKLRTYHLEPCLPS